MAKAAAPRRRATPPRWFLVIAAATASIIVLHPNVYQSWQVYEWGLLAGCAGMALGLVAWIIRAFDAGRNGLAIVLVGCVLGLIGVALGAGGMVYPVAAGTALVFVLPLTLILGLLQLRLGRRGASRTLFAVAIACGVQFGAGALGEVVRWHDCEAAKLWCEELIPRFDAYHEKHGQWPNKLADVGIATEQRPRRIHGRRFWKVDWDRDKLRFSVRSRKLLRPTEWWWSTDLRQWILARL